MIKVLFFGPIAAVSGVRELVIEHTPGLTLGSLKESLAAEHPGAMRLAVMMAVNGEHAHDLALPLADNSEVAFMAKFSGG
ncbi:MAG: MoaD/ThiS family protein [Sideroxydans sp.]|jgi:molybdopterin synthase sulfur carrier subunit